ncbi:putative Rieske iron-sulfur protein [Haloferax elongans ATCC BAA-1513]|uniref:Putative Rieske iron-sulfur protein n=1 Tax=Haloferax elongans ATCC BAA-1513 TaxID=1230453 RepID=M0HND5_HALEO|nr:Rieske 2Fe-2S domain-containing protein [Haloferax elongans]ELZ84614.1 putative Rieske iron-sulfur protein [Haloferax elongans ATCC BAA-1513]
MKSTDLEAESGDCDSCCTDCTDDGNDEYRPSIFTDTRASLARRDYAKLLASVGGLTAVASLTAPLAGLTRVFEREYTGPVYSDGIYLVDGEGERIEETALAEGEKMTVFPEPRPGIEKAPTLLVRHPEGSYSDTVKKEFMVAGYTAYSKVCTHAGCMVSDEEDGTLVCPCHFGKFDPTDGAAVVGGPPSRGLPQLPITVSSEGYLIATGDFNGPVGPGGE